jgi:RHS repeat-associated protein
VYGAYGKATVGIEEVENNFRFPGQYFDEESGLHYNFFRYYDTETGRYISVDLARDGINFYAYCEADPLNFVDPYGLVTDRAGRECDSNELKKVFIRVKRGTGPKDPGHVFVQTPNYTYGFYPDGKYHFFNHGPGVYIDDTEVKGDLYYEYEAGPETVKKLDDAIMMDVINGLLGRPSTYSVTNIGGRNCAGKALEWIEKAGLPPPLSPRWPFVRPPWSSWGE